MEAAGQRPAVWTLPFTLAVAATTSIFAGFYLLIPALPPFAAALGASKSMVGLVISIYSLAAIPARLLSGSQMDRLGRKRFLLAGLVIFAVTAGLYTLAGSLRVLLALRILHGLSWGWITTAMSALVAEMAPASRRGEAIGYWSLAPTLAMAIAPMSGTVLISAMGFPAVFAATAGLAGFAAALVVPIREPQREAAAAGAGEGRFPRAVLLPAAVLFFSNLSYGSIMAFVPVELARPAGSAGAFFSIYAVTILITRPLAGKFSDRWGRAAVIQPGLVLGAAGVFLLGLSPNRLAIGAAAILYGAGIGGAAFPGLMALTVDRFPPASRSAALAGFFTAYDLAIASGAALLGPVYQRLGFVALNVVSGGGILVALGLLLIALRREKESLTT